MNVRKGIAGALVIIVCAVTDVLPVPPGLWCYTDEFGTPLYSGVELVDTFALGPPYEYTDSTFGILRDDEYDFDERVMNHFKWPYQFKKGWDGCKLIWEDRVWAWDVSGYDSLVIKYIGPLENHKIDISFGMSETEFDAAYVEYVGSLPSNYVSDYSTEAWKTVAIPIPPPSEDAPLDSARKYLREIRFIIHNVEGETSETSEQGFFYLDKVGFTKAASAVTPHRKITPRTAGPSSFVPPVAGKVQLSMYTLSGKLLFAAVVPVVAGQRYNVRRFTREHTGHVPSQWHLVRIKGSGINVLERIW